MNWNNIFYLIIGLSIGLIFSFKYCGDSVKNGNGIDSLSSIITAKDEIIKAKTSENVKLVKEVSKFKRQKDSLVLLQLKSTVYYKGLSKQSRIDKLHQIEGVIQINDSSVQLSMSAIDSINLIRIDNEYTHRQLKASDRIIELQDSIIDNDSLTIMSYQSIRCAQDEIIQTQKKDIRKLKFQKAVAILTSGILVTLLLIK